MDIQPYDPQRDAVVQRDDLVGYNLPLGEYSSRLVPYDRQRVGLGASLDNESVKKNLKTFQITETPRITDELRRMKSTDSFTRILQFVKNPGLLKVANASHETLLQFLKDEFTSYALTGTNYYAQSKIFDDWLITWEDILIDFRDFEKAAYETQQRRKESFSDVKFLFDNSKLQQSLVRFNELSPGSFNQFNQKTVAQYDYLAGFFDYVLSTKRPDDYRQNVDLQVIFEETPNSSTSRYLATPKIETILKILTEYQKIVTQEQTQFKKEADDIFVNVGFVAFQGYKTLNAEQGDLIKQYVAMVKDLVKTPGNAVFQEKNLVRRLLKQSPLKLANDKQLRSAFERALSQNNTRNLSRVVNNQKLLNYVQKLSRVSKALSKYGELALKENQLAFINVPEFQELGDTARVSKIDLLTQIVHFYSPGHTGDTGLYQVVLDAQLDLILKSFAQGHPEEKAIFQTIETDRFAEGFLNFCVDEPDEGV